MKSLSGTVRLRPTRIALLVRPNQRNRGAVSQFARLCACLWGGRFNPIIPVAKTVPAPWRRDIPASISASTITDGYLRFFEPDVFLEAEPGLANEAGIDRGQSLSRRVVGLTDFVEKDNSGQADLRFGLNLFELLEYRFQQEWKFVPRHERRFALINETDPARSFFDVTVGLFPAGKELTYIREAYVEACTPKDFAPTPEAFMEIRNSSHLTPFLVGRHKLQSRYSDHYSPSIFIFDSSKTIDLIDYWNLPLFRRDIFPVDVTWIDKFIDPLRDFVARNYRPLPGNPHGVMISTTVEFARSISKEGADEIRKKLSPLPQDSARFKHWYDPIWSNYWRQGATQPRRAVFTEGESDLDLSVDDSGHVSNFRPLAPPFADPQVFGHARARWANVLNIRDYSGTSEFAATYLPNIKKPAFPRLRLGEESIVTREGVVFLQRYTRDTDTIRLLRHQDAIAGWLQEHGITAEPSDAGRNGLLAIRSVGGLFNCHLFSDEGTIHLLDKMARTRTGSLQEWKKALSRRGAGLFAPTVTLTSFTDRNVIRLGMAVRCTECLQENWYDLTRVDYTLKCERCLSEFSFPQGGIHFTEDDWRFRVVGPFSQPGYARGAYSTALALRRLGGTSNTALTFSPGMNLKGGGLDCEVDFIAWYRPRNVHWVDSEPALVFGEAKSFGNDVFHTREISRLRSLADRFPGSYFVLATLARQLSSNDKTRIRSFAKWGRSLASNGEMRAGVIVLTGVELLGDGPLYHVWRGAGPKYAIAKHVEGHLDDLWELADLTQQIYLELPSWSTDARSRARRRTVSNSN